MPSTPRLIKNFTKAVVKHAKDGFNKVTVEEYNRRLQICGKCELREENRCSHVKCGCFLKRKAWWASEKCPIGKWEENGV